MTCADCGAACQGKYCSTCEQIRLNEKLHGDSVDGDDQDWEITQTGLDGDAEGQATLDGAIAKPAGGSE